MPRPAKRIRRERSGRYRANMRRQGMRLLRIRAPDPHAPGFEAEAGRQPLLLRQAPDETQALDFVAKGHGLGPS